MNTYKRYLISSGVTFLSAFCLAILPFLNDELTLEAIKGGALFAIVFAGLRAGIKAVIEYFFVK